MKAKRRTFICKQCSRPFHSNDRAPQFCSRVCLSAFLASERGTITCLECKTIFPKLPGTGGAKPKFCSRKCYLVNYKAGHPWNYGHSKYDPLVCEWCTKEFRPSNQSYGKRRYCSRACLLQHRRNGGHHLGDNRVGAVRIKTMANGYQIKIVKCADGRWRKEHRVIAERIVGRPLLSTEVVHHCNGNSIDNADTNLRVMGRKEHIALHHEAEAVGLSVMCANDWSPSVEGMGC